MNKKGFVFIETIIVISILLASLMIVYSLYVSSINKENKRLRYDDPVKLYQTFYMKQYLNSFRLNELEKNITNENPYINIYGQSDLFGGSFSNEKKFFERITDELNIETILLTTYDVSLLTDCKENRNMLCTNNNLIEYLSTLDNDGKSGYRLIIEYKEQLNGKKCENKKDCYSFYSNVWVGD